MPSAMAIDADDHGRQLGDREPFVIRRVALAPILSIRSCVTAPADARIKPLTVPSTVVKAIAEMTANSSSLKLRAKQRRGHVAVRRDRARRWSSRRDPCRA